MLKFLHFWNAANGYISSTHFNCCFDEIWYCLCGINHAVRLVVISDFAFYKTDQLVMSMLFTAFWII